MGTRIAQVRIELDRRLKFTDRLIEASLHPMHERDREVALRIERVQRDCLCGQRLGLTQVLMSRFKCRPLRVTKDTALGTLRAF